MPKHRKNEEGLCLKYLKIYYHKRWVFSACS